MKKVNCILLVEDNPGDNYFNEYIIMDAGVCSRVKVAINGNEALDYLRKCVEQGQSESFPVPDILFLDINMPRMNGFEFLDVYRKFDENLKSKVLIVMLTTSLNPDDQIKAMNYKEISEYKNKPLSQEMLEELMEKYF